MGFIIKKEEYINKTFRISKEQIDLPLQYMHYPWNINNKLVYGKATLQISKK